VALKVQSAEIAHKFDTGGVHSMSHCGRGRGGGGQGAHNARRNCPGATIDGTLVQEMVEDGVELILA
jgi:hypothetical protein